MLKKAIKACCCAAWIWRNCPSRVLEGMAAGLGEQQLRRLITKYQARQALLDMGPWSGAFASLVVAPVMHTCLPLALGNADLLR